MPLTVSRRPGRDGWWISGTVTPAGAKHGVRVRRRAGSDDPRLAREEATALEARILRDAHLGERPEVWGWGEAVASYLKHEARSPGTLELLTRLTRHFRDTPLDRLDQGAVDKARGAVLRPDAAPGTVLRNLIVPVRAVMHHAALRGKGPEPRLEAPAQPKGRTPCLLPAEWEKLAGAMHPKHTARMAWFIGTGCRRSESLALDWADVDLTGATARLWPDTTKTGEGRVVRLVPAVVAALAALPHREGSVFGEADARKALATASARSGVAARGFHDFRHTWASWHYALHRDLLRLRDDGGWATVAQVECYAHRMPVGHEAAIRRIWGLAPQWQRSRRVA